MTADPAAVRASLADATPDVFWTDRPERPSPRASLTGSGHRADLVVVGGGFTGLWAAIQAKEDDPSRDVVVLERGRFGVAASGRNGGFVASSLTHGLAQGLACWPDEIGTLERLADENRAGLEATLTTYGIDADYHVPGEITMALSEHQVASVREGYELHRDHGVAGHPTWMPPAARARVDSPRYLAGFLDPTVGLVDPGKLVWGLADAAERSGVRLHEDTTRHGVRPRGRRRRRAHRVGPACAPTGWCSVPGPSVARSSALALYTLPVYDHVLMSEPLSPAQLDAVGWRGREGLTDAGNQFHYYRRTLDDRVLFGGYDANYHFPGRIDPRLEQSASHDLLARHFFEIFPQLAGAAVHPPLGRRHRHHLALHAGVRHRARWAAVVRRRLHRAGGRLDPLRCAGRPRPRRRPRHRGDPAGHGAAQADAVPPRADPLRRGARDPRQPGRRGPHRASQPVAARARCRGRRLRQLTAGPVLSRRSA